MQRLLIGVSLLFLLNSCSKIEEGFLGEWEGTINQFNASGKLVEVNTSCEIKSKSGNERSVLLTVGGNAYDFVGIEMLDEMTYEDYPLNSDSTVIKYISGMVELVGDTLLVFDHQLYALKNGALLNSDRQQLEMTRK